MAYRIYNKFPEDLQKGRRAIGVSLPFTGRPSNPYINDDDYIKLSSGSFSSTGNVGSDAVFNPTYTTKDQIKSNLINYFLTNKGERVFNPFFGANLRARLFEQITAGNANTLKKQVEDDLKTFFPLVSIQKLEVINNEDENSFTVALTYNVVNFGISDTINLTVQ
jgi:phage baseplate assembly protein W